MAKMYKPASPNDPAISVGTISSKQTSPTSKQSASSAEPKAKSTSPRNAPPTQAELTPAEQAASGLETATALQQAQAEIELVFSDSATDPGYLTDTLGSANSSLASSVHNYRFENGRRYHIFREGAYNFPNDETEQDREDLKHAMVLNLCGGRLHFANIGENPQNILDMGTGTGIWAIEMGDFYPGATVLGVDLSPIQPQWVPPNVKFMVDDVESPWLRPLNHFDYMHGRHLSTGIKNWPHLMSRTLDHLKPGGWLELQEIHHLPQCHDGVVPSNHPIAQYWNLVAAGLSALGVDLNNTLLLADMMRDAGFINVETRIFHVPIGVWLKNKVLKMVGLYFRTILIDGLSSIALGPYTRGLGWKKEQVDVWLVTVRKAYLEGGVHFHMPLYVICGQKPELGASSTWS